MPDFTQDQFTAWASSGKPPFTTDDTDMRAFIIALRAPGTSKVASDYPRRQAVAQWLKDDADGSKANWLKPTPPT